jgi:hypothetical protein
LPAGPEVLAGAAPAFWSLLPLSDDEVAGEGDDPDSGAGVEDPESAAEDNGDFDADEPGPLRLSVR